MLQSSPPKCVDEQFEENYSQFFRVVWTVIIVALAIGLFGDFFYETTKLGAFPIALFWAVIAPLWLTYLVHKDNELDAESNDLFLRFDDDTDAARDGANVAYGDQRQR